VKLFDFEL
jgi:type IV secretory pathway VirB6-like protein